VGKQARKRKTGDEELDRTLEDEVVGRKNDEGKLRYDLDSVAAAEGRVAVLTHGAAKYRDRNWEKGILYSRVYAALQRHLHAWWGGSVLDEDTHLHPLSHAACELMFLQEFEARPLTYEEFDDRPSSIEID